MLKTQDNQQFFRVQLVKWESLHTVAIGKMGVIAYSSYCMHSVTSTLIKSNSNHDKKTETESQVSYETLLKKQYLQFNAIVISRKQ